MKLSKLIEALQLMDTASETDPEIVVWLDDVRLEFGNATLTSTCETRTGLGELSLMPTWEEELIIYMNE